MRRSGLHALFAGSLTIAALTTTTGIHAQPHDQPPNLLPNGGFERGLDGWVSPDGATLDPVDNPVHPGDPSARVTANGPGKFTLMTEYWRVPTEPLAGYTLRVWLYADTNDPEDPANSKVLEVVAGLEFLDADGARVGDLVTERLANPAAAWQLVEVGTATAPSGAVYARVSLTAEAAGAGATFYVDSAELTASAPPPATPSPTPEAEPSFFASLTNGNFELPGDTPFGWRAHAGDASIVPALEGRPRVATLRSEPGVTAWLQQSVAVGGGRWYEAAGWLRPGANADRVLISVAWYASEDASGDPLSSADSDALRGAGGSSATVSTGPILAPDDARSARIRIVLRPTGESRAVLHADDVSFARTAPPAPASAATRPGPSSPALDAMPTFFVALTNGDFELPGDAPYGWRAHAGDALVTTEGGSRAIALTSRGRATAWLHQSFAIEAGRWYEASGRLQTVSNASLARIRVAWYASDDASGAQLATADSDELSGVSDSFAAVSSGAIRAPEDARSAELRIMLRPAGATAATLRADDVSFARIAPPEADATPATPTPEPSLSAEATPSFFAALTNGDFELPGDTPYGWLAHAGDALVATEGGSRAIALTSRGAATAWLHQSFAVEGGRWYEVGGRLRPGSNASLARIRIAWYASEDASGAQLSTADSEELSGVGDSFSAVSTGAIRAPDDARSAQLRVMLRPAGDAPAVLHADDVSFARTAPPPAPTAAAPDAPTTTPEAAPSFFPTLTNGDFELPGETPYGWRSARRGRPRRVRGRLAGRRDHLAGQRDRLAAPVVRRRGRPLVRGGRAAAARFQRLARPHPHRLVRLGRCERGSALHCRLRGTQWGRRLVQRRLDRRDPRARRRPQRAVADHAAPRGRGARSPARRRRVLRADHRAAARPHRDAARAWRGAVRDALAGGGSEADGGSRHIGSSGNGCGRDSDAGATRPAQRLGDPAAHHGTAARPAPERRRRRVRVDRGGQRRHGRGLARRALPRRQPRAHPSARPHAAARRRARHCGAAGGHR